MLALPTVLHDPVSGALRFTRALEGGAAECARQKALVTGVFLASMESKFAEEVIARGTAKEEAGTSVAVASWVCQVFVIFVSWSEFDKVAEAWTKSARHC